MNSEFEFITPAEYDRIMLLCSREVNRDPKWMEANILSLDQLILRFRGDVAYENVLYKYPIEQGYNLRRKKKLFSKVVLEIAPETELDIAAIQIVSRKT